MNPKSEKNSERAPEPVGPYPHARQVGNILYLSGVGPRAKGKKEIPGVTLNAQEEIEAYDIEAQCHAVFENVRLVLEDAGSDWENIVDVLVFLTNMKDDFKSFNRIYGIFKICNPTYFYSQYISLYL